MQILKFSVSEIWRLEKWNGILRKNAAFCIEKGQRSGNLKASAQTHQKK